MNKELEVNLSLFGTFIESLETLGGCHRVRYVKDDQGNMIHTEHGPRIYLGAYLDFWEWIKSIDVNRDKNFLKYPTLCSNEQARGREIAVRLMIR